MTQPDLFDAPAAAPMRTLYPRCGAEALAAYCDFNGKAGRRWRDKRKADARRIKRRELLEHALALIDAEAMLWPRDVRGFLEHNAQLLAALYAERDEREA